MTPKPHHALDYARGISRIKACISYCKFATTTKGTLLSDRFKEKDFYRLIKAL